MRGDECLFVEGLAWDCGGGIVACGCIASCCWDRSRLHSQCSCFHHSCRQNFQQRFQQMHFPCQRQPSPPPTKKKTTNNASSNSSLVPISTLTDVVLRFVWWMSRSVISLCFCRRLQQLMQCSTRTRRGLLLLFQNGRHSSARANQFDVEHGCRFCEMLTKRDEIVPCGFQCRRRQAVRHCVYRSPSQNSRLPEHHHHHCLQFHRQRQLRSPPSHRRHHCHHSIRIERHGAVCCPPDVLPGR
mmetsp:Transcript_7517/g.16679  ORF Transcript_7517/g.16679 Transcript_7517/m.16679 type:complete len:242 (+) Transcript_7517:230-955(+)